MKNSTHKIFLDLDGVVVDFDKQFQALTGLLPNDFESKFDIAEFWNQIDNVGGVGFWRGMEFMPGGKELVEFAVDNFEFVEFLSSPSRGQSSKIGKRLWRRDKFSNVKLNLAYSAKKKEFVESTNSVLVDDRTSNINQWNEAGGTGILYKDYKQVKKQLQAILVA